MSDGLDGVRDHYRATGLTERLKTALRSLAPDDQRLAPQQLAGLDQFHTRGLAATAEIAKLAGISAGMSVLDVGSGIGGPARFLAETSGCRVTGVDLSEPFVEAARYLTERTGQSGKVSFQTANALKLPFDDGNFDIVLLQHVAMNIEDRPALYTEVRRVLAPGGRLATYDLVCGEGDILYPVPWARDASTSFLLSQAATRTLLEQAGFSATVWIDDTDLVLDWFSAVMAGPQSSGPNLGLVMGPDFRTVTANLARNIREKRLRVLSAVLIRN